MKNKLMIVAALAMFSTTAMAEDYDNTAIKLTAVTDNYSISIKAPETGAQEFAFGTTAGPVDVTATWKRNGAVDNYVLKAGKEVEVTGPVYAGASAEFTFGDSYNSDTRTLAASPYVGVAQAFGQLTPYAEVGYAWQSTQKDIVDFNRDSSYVEVGASYAVTEAMSVKLSVVEDRDADFKNPGDRNATVGVTVKF